MRLKIIDKLYKIYKHNGNVTEETVFDTTLEYNLSLDEVEIICGELLSRGVEISDEPDVNDDKVFDKVIMIDDSLKLFINEARIIIPT